MKTQAKETRNQTAQAVEITKEDCSNIEIIEMDVNQITEDDSSSNFAEIYVMNVSNYAHNNVLLPTFTADLANSNDCLRFLYDPASQGSFISKHSLRNNNYHVLKPDIKLQINGFNESKLYKTSLIETEVKINDKIHKIQGAVVPEIKVKVKVGKFDEIRQTFHNNGLSLADKRMNDPIDVLIGAGDIHILPVHACSFGTKGMLAHIYYTSLGIILLGSEANLMHNLKHIAKLHIVLEELSKFIKNVSVRHRSPHL